MNEQKNKEKTMEDKNLGKLVERINACENPRKVMDALTMLALFRSLPPEAREKVIDLARVMVDQNTEESSN